MSISPINFNGMIQSTTEVKSARASEDSKTETTQAAVTLTIDKKTEELARQVNGADARDKEYEYDREGDGKGYKKNANKKLLKKKSEEKKGDGKVIVKPTSTFDIKI